MGADWSVKLIVIATKEWRGCACSAHCFIVCLFAVSGQGLLDGDSQREMSFSLSLCQQEFTIWLIYPFRPWGNSPPLTPLLPPSKMVGTIRITSVFWTYLKRKLNIICLCTEYFWFSLFQAYILLSQGSVSQVCEVLWLGTMTTGWLCVWIPRSPPPPPPPQRRSVNPVSVSPLGVTQGSLAFRPFKVAWSPVYTFCTLMYTTVVIL